MNKLETIFQTIVFLFLISGLGLGVVIAILAIFISSLITVIAFIIVSPIIEKEIKNKSSGIKKTVSTIIRIIRALLSIHSYILFLCFISFSIYSFSFFTFELQFIVFILIIVVIQFIIFIIFKNKLNKIYTNIFLLLEPYILIIVIRLYIGSMGY